MRYFGKLIAIQIIFFASCTENYTIRKNIEGFYLPKMDDPSEYEFSELEIIDTITAGEQANRDLNGLKRELKDITEEYNYTKQYRYSTSEYLKANPYDPESIQAMDRINAAENKYKRTIQKMDSLNFLLQSKNIDSILYYKVLFRYRTVVGNEKRVSSRTFLLDSDKKVKEMGRSGY